MAKNNQLINAMKSASKYYKQDKLIVDMFSAFVLALNECGVPNDDISYILATTQEEWDKSVKFGYDIADHCYEVTDFDVRRAG